MLQVFNCTIQVHIRGFFAKKVGSPYDTAKESNNSHNTISTAVGCLLYLASDSPPPWKQDTLNKQTTTTTTTLHIL